jgi:hypothetical protein
MNTQATLDFCKMVIEYMKLDCEINPLNGYAINYGEINEWTEKYHNMCETCMEGHNDLADAADNLVLSMYEFAKIASKWYVHKEN